MLQSEQLRALLRYYPETGIFTWLADRNGQCPAGAVAGTITAKGYVRISILGRKYRAHRLAWLYMTGEWPDREVDHKNTVRHDNRWSNLRLATGAENSRNRRTPITNTSGRKGVHWSSAGNCWQALIDIGGKRTSLGYFVDIDDAHRAYVEAAAVHYGEFARAA